MSSETPSAEAKSWKAPRTGLVLSRSSSRSPAHEHREREAEQPLGRGADLGQQLVELLVLLLGLVVLAHGREGERARDVVLELEA